MNKPDKSSRDANVDRRDILKLAAGMSAFAVAPEASASATLANNGEIVALSARAAADCIRRGELSAERYATVLLDQYKAHANLNTVTYIDEAKLVEDLARSTEPAREARRSDRWPACR